TVLITGASRGIGAETAVYFAKMGYDVAINFKKDEISAKKVLEKVENLGRKGLLLKADVSDQEAVIKMVANATHFLGTIDVLVNNAGIAKQALFTDVTEAEWNRLFSVNVGGMFHTISAVLPQMLHRKEGAIVNVSSVWGICGASCEVHYSASKAAIIGATKALALELAPSNIRINCVAPGVIDTEMNHNLSLEDLENLKAETPLGKIGTPEDIAKAIYFLAENDLSSFITGQVLSPNGGFVI
ncbi:MAG: 3-oxoacyl-ACP reductase FabG, partial [Clostridia bacterium]|nr:3-oxoacyl-ACP reductase FabG [Clostridia bacterium]